jgi:hypothetical protein
VAHIVLFVAEPYRPSPSTEDTTLCGIEPALDSVCVHTRRDAVVFDNLKLKPKISELNMN